MDKFKLETRTEIQCRERQECLVVNVRELILPFGKRLSEASNRMKELPYALYDSQDVLVRDIVNSGKGKIKQGLAILGGVQINTGPETDDYFHPLRFDYYDENGNFVEDLLPSL